MLRGRLLALALGAGALASGCPAPPRAPDKPVKVRAITLDAALPGYTCGGRPGDLLLQHGELRAVVASGGDSAERRMLRGSLIDAVVGRWQDDGLAEQRTVVFAGNAEAKARVIAVEPVTIDGRQAVRVVQQVARPKLRIVTEVRAEARELAIVSEVENLSSAPVKLRVGDRLRWHGPHPFMPGTGFVEDAAHVNAPWMAQQGRPLSYALVPTSGPVTVKVITERQEEIVEQVVLGAPRTVAARNKERVRRHLVLARGGLGAVAERAWAIQRRDFAVATGTIKGADERATVTALDRNKPVLTVHTSRDGRWSMPLPLGTYRLRLQSPGGEDEAALKVDREGGTLSEALVPPTPGELRVLVSDEKGTPLPARILVRGVPPTADPNFGDEQVAKGYANVAYTLAGDARLTVPAGSYRVTVTHGPERELATQQVDIDAARGGTMRARLARAVTPQGWLACDFHVHAAPSFDSRVPLMDRVTALVAEGIDFAVATDHNHVTDYAPTIAELSAPLGTATGIEITTRSWGHFNAFPFPASQPPPPFADIDPAALFAHVRQHAPGSVIQVNHARMGDIGYFNRGRLDPRTGQSDPAFSFDFDTLEVFNGFDLNGVDRVEEYVREWLTLMAFGRRYTAVGSSDSHKIAYQWAGYPRTYVRVAPDAARDQAMAAIIDALRRGRAMVTNGPFLDVEAEDKGLGSIVKARNGRVRLRVEVLGPQWIEVDNLRYATLDGPVRLAAEPGEGAVRLRFEGEIEVRRDTFLVVAVRGSKRMEEVLAGASALPFAFTNPIWIDADADGALNISAP